MAIGDLMEQNHVELGEILVLLHYMVYYQNLGHPQQMTRIYN